MNKKAIYVLFIILIVAVLGLGYYFNKINPADQVNNNQGQEQNNDQGNGNNSGTSPDLKAKILELVGKANEGKNEEALTGYLALEKDNPTDLLLLNNIADLYSDMGNWTKAEEYYKKLLNTYPSFIQGYRMLAYLYQYRFNDDEVKIKALIDDGLSKNNNHPDLLSWIIDYYQQKEEGEKALPYSELMKQQIESAQ